MLDAQFDQQFRDACGGVVCGVDEAGRGPLAGPVYAAAVILSPDAPIEGLNDSKKLSEKKREQSTLLTRQRKYFSLKMLHGTAFAFEGQDADIRSNATVTRKIMKFIWLMESHFSAFQYKSFVISRTNHFPFINVYHFPKIVFFPFVIEVFRQLHIENGYNLVYIKYFFKT